MAELDYTPNSHKFKEETQSQPQAKPQNLPEKKPTVEKVVSGKVKTKKKNEIRKFTDVFIAEDAHNVGSYILNDVVVPAVKKLIVDMVTDGINMIFFNTTGRGGSGTNASYTNYRSYSDTRRDDRRYSETRTRSGYSYDEIVFDTRRDADDVLSRMDELIDTYGMVSVADMYDLVGQSCNYTDNNYGWTSIRSAEVYRARDGWMIRLPKVLPIK